MERLDKIISEQTSFSRSETKKLILNGKVLVNGNCIKKSEFKIDTNNDEIFVDGKKLEIKKYVYLILNKPKGYVSATFDENEKTVLELVPEEYRYRDLFPAGRLDKDTTGLMIITDDGIFAHDILSPKKHVSKTYEVKIDIPMSEEMISEFKSGVKLKDGECKTALLEITGENSGTVTITEGRYHQIKRMFGCFGAKVLELNRIKMGNLDIPTNLEIGECRELTLEELKKVKNG